MRWAVLTLISAVNVCVAVDSSGAQVVQTDSAHHVVVPLRRSGVVVERVLGDPKIAGAPYVIRIRNEDNFVVIPHTHPENEHVVVLQGIWHLATGARFDRSKLRPLSPGDFVFIPKRMPHFGWSKGETIIQVHGIGPFRVDFVDPAYLLSEAQRDTAAIRHFRYRPQDTVAFTGGRGVIVDGMASPANGIVQYLVQTQDRKEIVLGQDDLRPVGRTNRSIKPQ